MYATVSQRPSYHVDTRVLMMVSGSNTGPNGKTTTTIVTTVGSETATGIYELDTITQYASLRDRITITSSVTATTNGTSGVADLVMVVLAGGVAWFLAGEYST